MKRIVAVALLVAFALPGNCLAAAYRTAQEIPKMYIESEEILPGKTVKFKGIFWQNKMETSCRIRSIQAATIFVISCENEADIEGDLADFPNANLMTISRQ